MDFHPLEWALMAYGVLWIIEAVILYWMCRSMLKEGDWPSCDETPGVLVAALYGLILPSTRSALWGLWYWVFPPRFGGKLVPPAKNPVRK